MHGRINRMWHIHITELHPVTKRLSIYTPNNLDGSPENYTDGKDPQKIIHYIVNVLLHFKNYKIWEL